MPKAYLFAEIDVTDPVEFERYRQAVPPTIAAYGGRYLVRGGDPELIEGELDGKFRTVILEFPSRERLMEWYHSPEYKEPRSLRFQSATTRVRVMTGTDD